MKTERELAAVIEAAFTNGDQALTFPELAARALGIKESQVTDDDVVAVREYLPDARWWLEKSNICTILVTDVYFESYHGRRQPQAAETAKLCIALHWRKAAGIRLMTRKRVTDDVLGVTWLYLNCMSAAGKQSAILKRIAIENSQGKMTLPKAMKLIRNALAYKTPENHVDELNRLIDRVKVESGDWQLERKNGAPE
jgi:hypothetical protein